MNNTFTAAKKRNSLLIGIIVLLVCSLAFCFTSGLVPASKANADEPIAEPYIEFTTDIVGDTTRYIDSDNIGDTVVVRYKITHNDGVNSIVLIPEFDSDVFALESATVNESTVLGEATPTGEEDEGYDGAFKLTLENTGSKFSATDGENEFFLTVTYELIAAVDGER